ncbi:MAG: glutaredoxin domain-containing protein [Patescibacteria group bacterium]
MKKAIIYVTTYCPYCHMAKEYLIKKGVVLEEKNVETDLKARDEMIQKSGQMGVPVLDIEGKIIVGFSQEEIEKALEE